MTKKLLLAISVAAIFTVAITFSVMAEAITPIKQTEVKVKNDEISKLRFQLSGSVETAPFGGYAILTDAGTAIAITSHAGFYDSVKQTSPSLPPIIQFPGSAALCAGGDAGCGAEWHAHVVVPAGDVRCFTGLKVGELTFHDPSEKLKVAGNNLIANGIPLGVNQYLAALAGGTIGFDTGSTPGTSGIAFDLTPIFLTPGDPTTLDAVCIGPLAEE